MKKLILASMLGAATFLSTTAIAATASNTFNVNISLTSVCTVASTTNASISYLSFTGQQGTPTDATATVKCTNYLPYTVALNGTGTAGVYTYNDAYNASTNAGGTDLTYTLTLSTTSGTGTGLDQTINITPAITSTGSGRCATPTASVCTFSRPHTLTVSY